MTISKNKINIFLNNKKLTLCNLAKLMHFSAGALYDMVHGKSPFSENAIKKLLPVLEVSPEEFQSWIVADKYSKDLLELAIQTRKTFPYKKKSVLTVKIDEILKNRDMSRTNLAKMINYSQSGLNRMIIGDAPMSKSVIERVSNVLEIPQNEIQSWIIADKYSLKVLELAHEYNKDFE
jgi:transcriptional regulator with XRE-family HTH domain